MKELHKNETWDLVDLTPGRKAFGIRCVYKVNKNNDGFLECYKAPLVEKVYVQN